MPIYRLNVWRLSELGEKDVQAYYVIMLNEIAETEHDMKFSMERGGGSGGIPHFSECEREEKSESRLLMLSSWSCTLFHGKTKGGISHQQQHMVSKGQVHNNLGSSFRQRSIY